MSTTTAAGYTHLVTYTSAHKTFGTVENSFPTTEDAVVLWQHTMEKNQRLGLIDSFSITKID